MDMTDTQPIDVPKRRQASPDAVAGREASLLVRQLNRQLGQWQASSVKLHAIASRRKDSGPDEAVTAEALTLLKLVRSETEKFEALIAEQPPMVAEHGRIQDTRRSFEMVTERLVAALRMLGLNAVGE
jgi:hypothetical protein